MRLEFLVPWPPTVNTYWRHVVLTKQRRVATLLSEEARRYRERVTRFLSVSQVPRHALQGKLAVELVAYPPDRRARDLDNLPKGLLDALKYAGVIRDDADIDDLRIRRGPIRPGGDVEVSISELGDVQCVQGSIFEGESDAKDRDRIAAPRLEHADRADTGGGFQRCANDAELVS